MGRCERVTCAEGKELAPGGAAGHTEVPNICVLFDWLLIWQRKHPGELLTKASLALGKTEYSEVCLSYSHPCSVYATCFKQPLLHPEETKISYLGEKMCYLFILQLDIDFNY